MEKKRRAFIAVLLVFSLGNYTRLAANSQIRAVEFISILTIGIAIGLLLREVFESLQKK